VQLQACFAAVLSPAFDLNDAQCMIVSAECTHVLVALLNYLGEARLDELLGSLPAEQRAPLLQLLKQAGSLPAKQVQKEMKVGSFCLCLVNLCFFSS